MRSIMFNIRNTLLTFTIFILFIANSFAQVNIDGDINKSGLTPEKLFEFMYYAKEINIMPAGLMCIPNITSDRRVAFSKMQNINEELKNNFQDYQGQLSMGMSDDYEIALDYGATIVRVGSKIFS